MSSAFSRARPLGRGDIQKDATRCFSLVLSFFLLAIPYVTRAYEMCMASHARFAAVVFPAYIVLARLLHPLPDWVIWVVIGAFTMILMTWTALYAAGHLFF